VSVVAVLRGPEQWLRGITFYDVLRSPVEADQVVVSDNDRELLFASGTQLVHAFHVETVRHWDDEIRPGITRLAFVTPLSGVDAATFRRRYQAHAAIAREQHPGICRYVQHFVRRGTDRSVAAIAELHFADDETMRRRFYRDEGSASMVEADITDYLDRERTWSMITRLVV
jgi:hypothetical protein